MRNSFFEITIFGFLTIPQPSSLQFDGLVTSVGVPYSGMNATAKTPVLIENFKDFGRKFSVHFTSLNLNFGDISRKKRLVPDNFTGLTFVENRNGFAVWIRQMLYGPDGVV